MTKQIANKYAGKCGKCGTEVPAGAGFATAELVRGQKATWVITCGPCETGEAAPQESFPLTDEQQAAVAKFTTGETFPIEAGAGTGKTSTLVAIARATERFGSYVAFNRAIVQDARAKMPKNVACSTMSALAMNQIGREIYGHRLDRKDRVRSSQLAQRIGIAPFFWTFGEEQNVVQPGKLASVLYAAINRFCTSADTAPGPQHFEYIDGIDLPDEEGHHTYVNNDKVRAHLAPHLAHVWADLMDPQGQLPRFNMSHIEKIWQLGVHGTPKIPGSFILFDEAQDANPVYLDVVRQQGKQVVYVGDSQQQIYEWRGAVNALADVEGEACFLTNSFRFGPEIAHVANEVLSHIPSAQLRLVGRGQAGSTGRTDGHDAILCRSNAGAIGTVLELLAQGRKAHLVGGGGEVEAFAKAARQLQTTGATEYPDLACFTSWGAVQDYVQHDSDGADLKVLVQLIDTFGVESVLQAVANTTSEADADVIVSTAHKAKGREWDTVRLNSDFPAERTDPSERRLLYVAATRARVHLDYSICPALLDVMGELEEADVA